jgi:hypothetical protein
MARRPVDMAHPTAPDAYHGWNYHDPHQRARDLASFAGRLGFVLGLILVVLATGMLAGAVIGVDLR